MVHLGYKAEKTPEILDKKPANREEAIILATLKDLLVKEPGKWHRTVSELKGNFGRDHNRSSQIVPDDGKR